MAKKSAGVQKPEILSGANADMQETLSQFIGQPIAILCARFNYRGIMSFVGKDHVVLAQARAVESSGASSQERPSNEDPVGSSVIISMNAIELCYFPNWCYAPLDD
jgi:hypothetical protein